MASKSIHEQILNTCVGLAKRNIFLEVITCVFIVFMSTGFRG
uniref:Uncharacterized protein n=1 Tax=Rhizophora mucronata TaxID=61149 RepID=A0A2P2N0N7_RHIMU